MHIEHAYDFAHEEFVFFGVDLRVETLEVLIRRLHVGVLRLQLAQDAIAFAACDATRADAHCASPDGALASANAAASAASDVPPCRMDEECLFAHFKPQRAAALHADAPMRACADGVGVVNAIRKQLLQSGHDRQ
ncbi:MAG: hypothetical protein ABI633_00760, partial [Burkholderiales bacterium]